MKIFVFEIWKKLAIPSQNEKKWIFIFEIWNENFHFEIWKESAIPLERNGKVEMFCLCHQENFEMEKTDFFFLKFEMKNFIFEI
jgi:hypothetical protein